MASQKGTVSQLGRMFPDWPQSPSDLVPLPPCDGPKLPAFDFKGPQEIEFVDRLNLPSDEGEHGFVCKVKIHGTFYALKVFHFDDEMWFQQVPHSREPMWTDLEARTLKAHYDDPFNCECRAYGRLRESGHTSLSVECFGYVLLDEKHEEALHRRFPLQGFNQDNPTRKRLLHLGGRQPPYRCIVKELGVGNGTDEKWYNKRNLDLVRREIDQLHQLGIIDLDIEGGGAQHVNNKISDFSTAVTMPHYRTNPELNPYLTPQQKLAMGYETFFISLGDYLQLDDLVRDRNLMRTLGGDPDKEPKITCYAFPKGKGLNGVRKLRDKPHRSRVFTFVDPRRYVDLQKKAARTKSTRWQLDPKPARWHYEHPDKVSEDQMGPWICPTLKWTGKNGLLFPSKGPGWNPFI